MGVWRHRAAEIMRQVLLLVVASGCSTIHGLKLPFKPQPNLCASFGRRNALCSSLPVLALGFWMPPAAFATEKAIDVLGFAYTPTAMVLQLAEQTASMEGIMRESAKEAETMTLEQRDQAGGNAMGPGVIGRGDMIQSVDVMIKNSQLETSIPNGRDAAATLRGIQIIARGRKGELSKDEYVLMAAVYSATRDELRKLFEASTPEERAEGKAIVRKLAAKDNERMRAMEEEEQKLRALRAKSKNEVLTPREPPPPPKAYKEDGASMAAMQKAMYAK